MYYNDYEPTSFLTSHDPPNEPHPIKSTVVLAVSLRAACRRCGWCLAAVSHFQQKSMFAVVSALIMHHGWFAGVALAYRKFMTFCIRASRV